MKTQETQRNQGSQTCRFSESRLGVSSALFSLNEGFLSIKECVLSIRDCVLVREKSSVLFTEHSEYLDYK